MAKELIEGLPALMNQFRLRMQKVGDYNSRPEIRVQYTAPYAIYVHENLMAYHASPTQAKFLERAVREQKVAMMAEVISVYRSTQSVKEAIKAAGNLLAKAAEPYVPIDTGALRKSVIVIAGD